MSLRTGFSRARVQNGEPLRRASELPPKMAETATPRPAFAGTSARLARGHASAQCQAFAPHGGVVMIRLPSARREAVISIWARMRSREDESQHARRAGYLTPRRKLNS